MQVRSIVVEVRLDFGYTRLIFSRQIFACKLPEELLFLEKSDEFGKRRAHTLKAENKVFYLLLETLLLHNREVKLGFVSKLLENCARRQRED